MRPLRHTHYAKHSENLSIRYAFCFATHSHAVAIVEIGMRYKWHQGSPTQYTTCVTVFGCSGPNVSGHWSAPRMFWLIMIGIYYTHALGKYSTAGNKHDVYICAPTIGLSNVLVWIATGFFSGKCYLNRPGFSIFVIATLFIGRS